VRRREREGRGVRKGNFASASSVFLRRGSMTLMASWRRERRRRGRGKLKRDEKWS